MEKWLALIGYCLIILILVVFITWFYKEYKKAKEENMQFFIIVILIAVAFPVIIFYLDDFNFFTKIGYLSNADSNNWHNFFATYGSTLVSTLISSVLLVWVTGIQISSAKEDSKIQLKMQNLPVLKFYSNCDKKSCNGVIEYLDCTYETDNLKTQLNLIIKNVGLGAAQNMEYQLVLGEKSDSSKSGVVNEIIEKDGEINYTIFFELPNNNKAYNRQIVLLVYYDDLLGNKYVQKMIGSIGVYKSTDGNKETFNTSVSVMPCGKYIEVSNDFDYEKLDEVIALNDVKKYREKEKKINERISNRSLVDMIVGDFMENQKNILDVIIDFFKEDYPNLGGCSGISDYRVLSDECVEVIIDGSMGIDSDRYIGISESIVVDVTNKKVKSLTLKMTKCSLNISLWKKFKFKRYLKQFNCIFD